MKRFWAAGILVGLFLAGCSGNDQTQTPQTKAVDPTVEQGGNRSETTTDYTVQMEALQKKVTEVAEKAKGLEGTNQKTGIQMLTELETVSKEIDLLEDEIEWEAKNGKMSAYRTYLKQLSQMENQLDAAENQVERQFGMDD